MEDPVCHNTDGNGCLEFMGALLAQQRFDPIQIRKDMRHLFWILAISIIGARSNAFHHDLPWRTQQNNEAKVRIEGSLLFSAPRHDKRIMGGLSQGAPQSLHIPMLMSHGVHG